MCASECETVCMFLCLVLLCVCESLPLTAAELSLIQLCLLSCLLAPPASCPLLSSDSAMVFPRCLHPASWPGLWANLQVSESPLRVCFLFLSQMVTEPALMLLLVSFPQFFFPVPIIYSFNKLLMPPTYSANHCAAAGDQRWIRPRSCSQVLGGD